MLPKTISCINLTSRPCYREPMMSKLHMILFTLFFCSSALAEQIGLVCEVPAEEGDEGCGPNNTSLTYRFSIETDDLDDKGGSTYGYQVADGCDASKARKMRYKLTANEDSVSFQRDYGQNRIIVDRESLTAVISSRSSSSPEFACRQEEGNPETWSKGLRKYAGRSRYQ